MTANNNDDIIPNQILNHYNITDEINSAISELNPLIPISPEQRQLLLSKFNWDIESLKNSFREYADTNSFLLENGVWTNDIVSVNYSSECTICYSTGKLLGLRCQHMACLNCWSKYLASKIRNNQCMLSCMELGCEILISNKILGRFFCSSNLHMAHRKLIKDSYINSDSSLAWCNRKCGMAVRRSNNDTVTCSCGSTFCFSCNLDAHYPATCRQIRDWEKQLMDPEQKTSSWILSNTRECPKCFVPIQKNGGCDHMTCYKCRYQYCWVCFQDCHHGKCKLSDITLAQSRLNTREKSNVFGQYAARVEHHMQCLEQVRRVLSANELQNTLNECRRVLMNSYVFGYYLKDEKNTSALEEHQKNLEIAVEQLALFKTGQRASKLAEECLKLRKALLAHCAEGAEHENLEGLQPVKNASTDKNASVEFSGAIIFGICFIIVLILCGFLLIIFYTQP